MGYLFSGYCRTCIQAQYLSAGDLWDPDWCAIAGFWPPAITALPPNLQHCLDIGCLREQLKVPSGERHELCRGLHAEQNVIIQAAMHGVITKGSTLYCTNHPCVICAKMIINAGIVRIVIRDGYHDKLAAQMLKEAGISVKQL